MTKKEQEKLEAKQTLKEWGVKDGTIINAKVNKVSQSGMSRNITLYITDKDGSIIDISYHAAKVLEWPYKDKYDGGIRVGGCGMDMLFHTIDSLSYGMGYGSICQDPGRTKPIEKTGQKGQKIKAIGLKYRHL